MRTLDASAQTALEQRAICLREFVWIIAKDRTTGAAVSEGYWSDLGAVSAEIRNPETGSDEFRTFVGAGDLIEISPIPMVANLTVQTVTITASQISNLNELVRDYEARQGRVEIYRGLFEIGTLVQLAPAYPRFVGFVDTIEIKTPSEGEIGQIDLTCVSHAQEMSRFNPATRSDAYLEARSTGDTFRKHAASVGTWELKWGTAS